MVEICYRAITQGDNIPLAKMIRQVFIEHNAPQNGTVYSDPTTDDLYKLFQWPKSVLWVADIAGEVVGCCGIYPTPGLPFRCAELVKLYLHPSARGKGIGLNLLNKSIDSAREFGYTQLYIESLPQFQTAINMYQKAGFTNLSESMGVSGHSSCNIWMMKQLDG
ncbi:MAG: GNAT family N-acetyltransferase [Bacteroidales bacterium]|nr:GNAT family N-acetyltransferase [Bacteroidales bacterium]